MRVLLVDDDQMVREVLELTLEDIGVEVATVRNGDIAKEALAIGPYDVVISDVRMDGKTNGFCLLDHVRRNYPNVPVILMSGWYSEIDKAEYIRPHLPVLRKPFHLDELQAALDAAEFLIQRREVADATRDVRESGTAT